MPSSMVLVVEAPAIRLRSWTRLMADEKGPVIKMNIGNIAAAAQTTAGTCGYALHMLYIAALKTAVDRVGRLITS